MRLALLALVIPLVLASMAAAQEQDQERRPLRGMREVRVVVESLHSSSITAGLVASQIQSGVEVQLRKRGIPVVPQSAPGESAYLYLRVITRQVAADGYPFNIDLQLRDHVLLVREPAVTTLATTWSRYRGGYAKSSDQLARDIRQSIGEMVESFADDYAAANPNR